MAFGNIEKKNFAADGRLARCYSLRVMIELITMLIRSVPASTSLIDQNLRRRRLTTSEMGDWAFEVT